MGSKNKIKRKDGLKKKVVKSTFTSNCPHCQTLYPNIDLGLSGKRVACGRCKERFYPTYDIFSEFFKPFIMKTLRLDEQRFQILFNTIFGTIAILIWIL